MRLASLAEIVRGRLLNTPSVSHVNRFVFEAAKVRRGDCYIAFFEEASLWPKAIENGAYAVIYEGDREAATDLEIGWIRVKEPERALLGLLRFMLVEKNTVVYRADRVTLALCRAYLKDAPLYAAFEPRAALERLQAEGPAALLLIDESAPIVQAAPEAQPITPAPLNAAPKGLFETVIVTESGPVRLPVSALFLDALGRLAALSLSHGFVLRWHTHAPALGRFEPVSIGFGDRVLIFDDASEAQAQSALAYVRQNAPWAKVFAPPLLSVDELAALLMRTPFQYAYLNGCAKEPLLAALEAARPRTPSLF